MRLSIFAISFVALALALPIVAAVADKPNIIFILADDAGIGDFGCYGGKHIPTPNIDRLAAEGMRFTAAYSGNAVCAPSRNVLMTGLHAGHCLFRKNGPYALSADTITVAQVLKKQGYATGGFGKWGLGNPGTSGVPEKHGFDVFFGYYDQVHAHTYFTDHLIRNSVTEKLPQGTYSHDVIEQETLKFIEANQSRPFFVYAAWTLPHAKYVKPPGSHPPENVRGGKEVRNYAAMVTRFDTGVGRVMESLKRLGLDDRTLVIVSSDNGANEEFIGPLHSTGGLRGFKRKLYEGGIRAPQIARWPGHIQPGTETSILTSFADFFATAADAAGAQDATPADSISYLPTLLGRAQAKVHPSLYWEIYEPNFQQAARMGDWKGYRTGLQAPLELYDVKSDRGERNNVAAAHPEVVEKLKAILAAEHQMSPYYKPGAEAWKKIENSSFSFSVPPSFKKTEVRGEDSFVEEYVADGITLSFDYGGFSNNFGDWPKETKFEDVKINGKAARIGTAKQEFHKGFPLSTQVHFKLDGGVALSMFAACKSEKEVAIARRIFETIAFKTK